jgi:hypothetical protein
MRDIRPSCLIIWRRLQIIKLLNVLRLFIYGLFNDAVSSSDYISSTHVLFTVYANISIAHIPQTGSRTGLAWVKLKIIWPKNDYLYQTGTCRQTV